MCAENKKPEAENGREIMVSELLSAISESEYPQYILDAVATVQEWMNDIIGNGNDSDEDIFQLLASGNFEEEVGIESLIERLEYTSKCIDILPNTKAQEGRPDVVVLSLSAPDYECGLRAAIDYAAVFSRETCRRVWVISDAYILDEAMKYAPHVDALLEQGISLRYILVTPWGWVELPLSGKTDSKRAFLWRNDGMTEEKRGRKNRG
ncbi:MAG: hypothetical protein IJG36_03440 [Synergistaceae bacterium]|nr:hypothetical protein [Synergistaceae bacterium]